MRKILATTSIAIIATMFSQSANAQWTKTTQTDDFSGETVELITNKGRVISGPQGTSALVYRKKNNREEIYWSTPDSYICTQGWSVQMRLNDQKPVPVSVSSSTSKSSVFFNRFDRIYIDLFSADKITLLLQDGCGTRLVSEFTGNALSHFPDIGNFNSQDNWTFDPKLGSVVTGNDPLKFTYRTIVTGAHDMSLKVNDELLNGVKRSKKYEKGTIEFGGNSYKAKVYPGGEYKGDMDGTFSVHFKDKEVVDTFIRTLKNDTPVKVTIAKSTYELVISDFSNAIKLIK
jgi:hypothetical protein